MAEPIVKWAGGKRRLLDKILKLVPADMPVCEPFAGGAALTLELGRSGSLLYDSCTQLMATYDCLRDCPDEVIMELRKLCRHPTHTSKPIYLRRRAEFNATDPHDPTPARAALFLYLNRACFNGLWRVNRAGEFNVPRGSAKRLEFDYDNLTAAAQALDGVRVMSGDVLREDWLSFARRCFWYVDPPYLTTYDGYSADGFGYANHFDLIDRLRDMADAGRPWLLSHADHPMYRELFADRGRFVIRQVEVAQTMAGRSKDRKATKELLIYPRELS